MPALVPAGAAAQLGRVVDSLGAFDEVRRMQLVRLLTVRIAGRLAECRRNLVRSRFGQCDAELATRIELGGQDMGTFETRLAAMLDRTMALALLTQATPGEDDPGTEAAAGLAASLLEQPSTGLQETALDVLFSPRALQRFDGHCQELCAAQISDMLDRLALSHSDREAYRQRLLVQDGDAVPPPPQHQDADEAAFLQRVRSGDHKGAVGLLAAAALVPVESVESAILLRSRRGLVSLAWKAGFSMRAAVLLQSQLAGIPPDTVLVATEDGSCPIGRSEMVWQIGFLARKLG